MLLDSLSPTRFDNASLVTSTPLGFVPGLGSLISTENSLRDIQMFSVAPFGKHIWCRAGPLREEDITHRPGLITGHKGIVQMQIAHYM